MVFSYVRRGDCERPLWKSPWISLQAHQAPAAECELSTYLRGAALKTVVWLCYVLVLLKVLCLFIFLLFFVLFLIRNNSRNQIASSFFSEALNLKKPVEKIIGQLRLEWSREANLG